MYFKWSCDLSSRVQQGVERVILNNLNVSWLTLIVIQDVCCVALNTFIRKIGWISRTFVYEWYGTWIWCVLRWDCHSYLTLILLHRKRLELWIATRTSIMELALLMHWDKIVVRLCDLKWEEALSWHHWADSTQMCEGIFASVWDQFYV